MPFKVPIRQMSSSHAPMYKYHIKHVPGVDPGLRVKIAGVIMGHGLGEQGWSMDRVHRGGKWTGSTGVVHGLGPQGWSMDRVHVLYASLCNVALCW